MAVLACIVCEQPLQDIGSGDANHANDANEFSTYGQYGSTVFDPMDGSRLAINVCDKCLVKAGHKGLIAEASPQSRYFKPWGLPDEATNK